MNATRVTPDDVLRAIARIDRTRGTFFGYIVDQLHRAIGRRPTNRHVNLMLASMERHGVVERGNFPQGMYGYFWNLTDAGRARIKELSA